MDRDQLGIKGGDTGNRGYLYKKMIEEIQDYAIILMDENGIILNWNKGAQKIKGYREEEIVGKHFSIFYLPEDLEVNLPGKLMTEARETGRAAHEGWRKRKDGSRFWGSITITAVHDDNDTIIGFSKVTRDLTDKKKTEDTLRMSEERYHQMIAEVQDYAIILLNADGVIENWNTGAEHIKGYKSEEIIGKHFAIFYTTEDLADGLPYRLLKEARSKGKAVHQGWRVRKDGTRFWGNIAITALHGKDNSVIGFSKVTRDLTQQKLADDRLAIYMAELEIQNNELEQFAFVASHDLQEPLRKIQTFAELIRDNFQDAEFVRVYFDKLDASAKRMSELVRSLLNYSRLAKDKTSQMIGEVDLNTIVKEVCEDFELLIEERKAIIHNNFLPVVRGDRIQLGQLFSNLISNAIKFCKTNPVITISVERLYLEEIPEPPKSLTGEMYYHIRFQDNGIGFEEKYSQRIFSLFQRLHGKLEYAGTGIGLALCKKIVENHKGHIFAESQPGQGATFHIYLPA